METLLVAQHPGLVVEQVIISTAGDRSQHRSPEAFTERGIFVKEIEQTLLAGVIDLAVHSLKDLPAGTTEGLTIAGYPPRADARDVLHCRDQSRRWSSLPPGARVGTSSQRRLAQLRHLRPDLEYVPIRGNVETRLAKVDRGDYDATVLAAAGLHRLGLDAAITEYLPVEDCLPEAGQGAIAVEVRGDDIGLRQLVGSIDNAATRLVVQVERQAVALIGGGCTTPTACYGVLDGDELWLRGMVATPDGATLLCASTRVARDAWPSAAPDLAAKLLALGAGQLLGPRG